MTAIHINFQKKLCSPVSRRKWNLIQGNQADSILCILGHAEKFSLYSPIVQTGHRKLITKHCSPTKQV